MLKLCTRKLYRMFKKKSEEAAMREAMENMNTVAHKRDGMLHCHEFGGTIHAKTTF